MPVSREYVITEIRRTAAENDGKPPGRDRFRTETGITPEQWGRHWARWGDALADAGFARNSFQGRFPDDHLLGVLAAETRRLGHLPTIAELQVRHAADASIPSAWVFDRWSRAERFVHLAAYCRERPEWADVLAIAEDDSGLQNAQPHGPTARVSEPALGQVYLIRSGKYFKIGHTRAFARRMRELDTALAEGRKASHIIATDDPPGIEAYWHNRFRDRRRGDTEWFDLTPADVAAFKRRKFM